MSNTPAMTARQAEKLLENAGWERYSQKGSHAHFKHSRITGKVTVPEHGNQSLQAGTMRSIFQQADLSPLLKKIRTNNRNLDKIIKGITPESAYS